MAFQWNIQPKGTNIYVDKRGDDVTGVIGDPQLPYKSIAKATSVGTSGNNIILGNGVWEEQRTLNNKYFNFYGCGMTIILGTLSAYSNDTYNNMTINDITLTGTLSFYYCVVIRAYLSSTSSVISAENSFLRFVEAGSYAVSPRIKNCVILGTSNYTTFTVGATNKYFFNNICMSSFSISGTFAYRIDYNNYTTLAINTSYGANAHSINNSITGQTATDYFNAYNITNYFIGNWTAKLGSKNLKAGLGGANIGLGLGVGRKASDTEFTIAGGATLQNLVLSNSALVLAHAYKTVAGIGSYAITLDSSASSVDDYYNGLYLKIASGTGAGTSALITDYNGTTKVATLNVDLSATIDLYSIYIISGHFESADIDFGKVCKIRRNWFTALFGYDTTTFTGNYLQKTSTTDTNVLTSPTFANFGMKYSTANDLSGKVWHSFSPNGETLFDGTYGDGEDGYTISNGIGIVARYSRIKFDVVV